MIDRLLAFVAENVCLCRAGAAADLNVVFPKVGVFAKIRVNRRALPGVSISAPGLRNRVQIAKRASNDVDGAHFCLLTESPEPVSLL